MGPKRGPSRQPFVIADRVTRVLITAQECNRLGHKSATDWVAMNEGECAAAGWLPSSRVRTGVRTCAAAAPAASARAAASSSSAR
eukprot:5047929-Pleurochrysis_carterae.AAC.2